MPQGQRLTFVTLENVCLAFGVLSTIATFSATLACLVVGSMDLASIRHEPKTIEDYIASPHPDIGFIFLSQSDSSGLGLHAMSFGLLAQGVFKLVMGVPAVIGFIFSVLLCYGVHKRRHSFVLPYFFYGALLTVLILSPSIVYIIVMPFAERISEESTFELILPGLLALLGCALYGICLCMVYATYKKLRALGDCKENVRLVEAVETF